MASANDLFETLKRWLQGGNGEDEATRKTDGAAPAPGTGSEPFVKEPLERDAGDKQAYGAWVERELAPALELLRLHFREPNTDRTTDRSAGGTSEGAGPLSGTASAEAGFLRHEGNTTRGLLVERPEQHLGHGAGAHLLDWCAERISGMEYYRQHAEVRIWDRESGVERLERIHLKPRFLYDEDQRISDQRYGNITLEHRLWNDRSVDWKLINNIYHDRSWTVALPFGELVERLLLHPK